MNSELDRMIGSYGQQLARAQRRQPARRRFPVRRVAIVGAVAGLAVGIGVAVLPDEGPVDVLAKAQAAITMGDKIEHYVLVQSQYHLDGTPERYGDGRPVVFTQEVWRRERPEMLRILRPGRHAMDQASDSDRNESFYYVPGSKTVLRERSAFSGTPNQIDMIRDDLRTGRLHVAGPAVVDGRNVIRLVGQSKATASGLSNGKVYKFVQKSQYRYDVDPVTYVPVQLWTKTRSVSASRAWSFAGITVQKFKRYEMLPPTSRNLEQLHVQAPHGTRVVTEKSY